MAAIGWLGYARLAHFSQPKHERALYKSIRQLRVHRIVEVGMASAERTVQLIRVAQRFTRDTAISYTGFDWFEERPAGATPMPLIHAHRQLQMTGARVRLVPGFPPATLPQLANTLQRTDLMIISSAIDDGSLDKTWFYLPRMCHDQTRVFREVGLPDQTADFNLLSLAHLESLAQERESRADLQSIRVNQRAGKQAA